MLVWYWKILGRICSSYGLIFGNGGLHAILYENTLYPKIPFNILKSFNQILLSENPESIYKFLNLNWTEYFNEFVNLTDIFEWIIKSKYFNIELFTTLNNANIKKLEKRPMYIQITNN